jgi:hypothetical protein
MHLRQCTYAIAAMKANYKALLAAALLLAMPLWFLTLGMSPNVPTAGTAIPKPAPMTDTIRPEASVLRTAQPMVLANDTLAIAN